MTPLESQQYLDSFINHEHHLGRAKTSFFKLERVQQLLKNLGDPHKDLKVIHVAGSKGKGSICALTASILQRSGYRVGLYTSPHINNYRERIRVLSLRAERSEAKQSLGLLRRHATGGDLRNNTMLDIFPDAISEEELRAVLGEIKPAVEKTRSRKELGILSFFEVYTVLALCYFRKRGVDFAVLETGMGGRLDATNTVDSLVAGIAPISLEHTRILGETVAQIAWEKAGIIKNRGQKVVVAPQAAEAGDVVENRCRAFHVDPLWTEAHVRCEKITRDGGRQIFDLITPKAAYERLVLPLLGKHQRDNAAVAVGIVECLRDLGFAIPPGAIEEGFKNVFWPGRFEMIKKDRLFVLDGAHNRASARALAETVREIFGDRKVVLVLGVSEDKDKESIWEELEKITRIIILTKADHPRARNLEGAVGVGQALDSACQRADDEDIILVTGSIFVVSEARRVVGTGKPVPTKI